MPQMKIGDAAAGGAAARGAAVENTRISWFVSRSCASPS